MELVGRAGHGQGQAGAQSGEAAEGLGGGEGHRGCSGVEVLAALPPWELHHYLPDEKCCSTCALEGTGSEQACPTPKRSWERLPVAFKQRLVNFLNAAVSN